MSRVLKYFYIVLASAWVGIAFHEPNPTNVVASALSSFLAIDTIIQDAVSMYKRSEAKIGPRI